MPLVYEVTVEFETALFANSSLTMTVGSMSDVVALQDANQTKTRGYRFVGYRGPINVGDKDDVWRAIAREKFEHEKVAKGG